MRSIRTLALLTCLIAFAGCHSPYVAATVSNRTSQPIDLLEVDYPSASFGTQSLAPGADFHYRFKVLGSPQQNIPEEFCPGKPGQLLFIPLTPQPRNFDSVA